MPRFINAELESETESKLDSESDTESISKLKSDSDSEWDLIVCYLRCHAVS